MDNVVFCSFRHVIKQTYHHPPTPEKKYGKNMYPALYFLCVYMCVCTIFFLLIWLLT